MFKTTIPRVKIYLLLFFGFTMFLSFNRHSKSGIQNYHSEIWADNAGYYIYLPSLFIYNFNAEGMPKDIDKKTGNGFFIKNGRIITKYSYGVALMQAPFFIACHGVSKLLCFKDDGFSLPYHKAINISSVVYSFFSLILLYHFLIRYLNKNITVISIICLYLGTNIFYYSIFQTGMSHIYSFFLFVSFLYLSPLITKGSGILNYILFGLIIGLIIVVRPINVMFLPVYFIFNSIKDIDFKKITNYVFGFFTAIVVIVPQLLYWKYSCGKYIQYSYGDEKFSNIFKPEVIKLFFSTNNGLFIYNPIIILSLIGLFFMYKSLPRITISIALYFVLISYVFASWHDWGYGCSYGCRPFVEYLSVYSLPFGFFIDKIKAKSPFKPFLIAIIVTFILYNQKLIFSYDGCWYGGIWDWSELLELIISKTK